MTKTDKIGIGIGVFFVAVLMAFAALAHDWYDEWCCNNKDCAPVISMKPYQGGFLLRTKHGTAFLPKDWQEDLLRKQRKHTFEVKESKDFQNHACIVFDVYGHQGQPHREGIGFLRCFYVAAQG